MSIKLTPNLQTCDRDSKNVKVIYLAIIYYMKSFQSKKEVHNLTNSDVHYVIYIPFKKQYFKLAMLKFEIFFTSCTYVFSIAKERKS